MTYYCYRSKHDAPQLAEMDEVFARPNEPLLDENGISERARILDFLLNLDTSFEVETENENEWIPFTADAIQRLEHEPTILLRNVPGLSHIDLRARHGLLKFSVPWFMDDLKEKKEALKNIQVLSFLISEEFRYFAFDEARNAVLDLRNPPE